MAGMLSLPACGSSSTSAVRSTLAPSEAHPAEADVVVSSCAFPDALFQGPQAKLTVTNHSSEQSSYIITVVFTTPDGATQLDTANTFVQTLAPGQSTDLAATSSRIDLREDDPKFTCKLTNVIRNPS
jgi:hypothetical protein